MKFSIWLETQHPEFMNRRKAMGLMAAGMAFGANPKNILGQQEEDNPDPIELAYKKIKNGELVHNSGKSLLVSLSEYEKMPKKDYNAILTLWGFKFALLTKCDNLSLMRAFRYYNEPIAKQHIKELIQSYETRQSKNSELGEIKFADGKYSLLGIDQQTINAILQK